MSWTYKNIANRRSMTDLPRLQVISSLFPWLIVLLTVEWTQAQIPYDGRFHWQVSSPLLSIDARKLPKSESHPWIAVKDPSVVRYNQQWHLFCTLRRNKHGDGRIRIGYLSFDEWGAAKDATWHLLDLTNGYHAAPQIFWFEPHRTWYLVYQAEDRSRALKYGPCYSTNDDITQPENWTLPEPIFTSAAGEKAGLDFWVICDDSKAYLFFTSLDGRMWRAETKLALFPNHGWSQPRVVLKADIFEASHTYKVAGQDRYLTVVEAQRKQRRYFKAFEAETLDGKWVPLAATAEKPLVSPKNVANQDVSWATSYSHGEFIRVGFDQTLVIDPQDLQLLFQGSNDEEYRKRNYGQIPWRLGLLTLVDSDDVNSSK